jgi:hypothetical protein
MTRLLRRSPGLLVTLVSVIAACSLARGTSAPASAATAKLVAAESAVGPSRREYRQSVRDWRVIELLAPTLVRLGDTVLLSLARSDCRFDYCLGSMAGWPVSSVWTVSPAPTLTFLPLEPSHAHRWRAIATAAGHARVTVGLGDTLFGARIEVVPRLMP